MPRGPDVNRSICVRREIKHTQSGRARTRGRKLSSEFCDFLLQVVPYATGLISDFRDKGAHWDGLADRSGPSKPSQGDDCHWAFFVGAPRPLRPIELLVYRLPPVKVICARGQARRKSEHAQARTDRRRRCWIGGSSRCKRRVVAKHAGDLFQCVYRVQATNQLTQRV